VVLILIAQELFSSHSLARFNLNSGGYMSWHILTSMFIVNPILTVHCASSLLEIIVTCLMNPFQRSILGVVDDFPYNQNKSGAEGSISPQTPFKLLTTHTKLR
jgi:hypothetical protein